MRPKVIAALTVLILAALTPPPVQALPKSVANPDGLPAKVRMPAEFETKDAIILGSAQMVQFHPQTLVEIVSAIYNEIQVVGLVGFKQERRLVQTALARAGLPNDAMTLIEVPVMTMWARDYGPLTVLDRHGQPFFLDANYQGRGGALDNNVPVHLADELEIPVFELPLTMEGGDLLTNGQGLCLSTQRLLHRNQEERGYTQDDVWKILQRYFGFEQWIPLPSLQGEPTGHLDMYLTFVEPLTVVVGQYDPAVDPDNAAWLDWVARTLDARETLHGPLRVERIPMPPHQDGLWRTYTNVVFANGVLLVPTYPKVSPKLNRQALAVYQRLLPEWEIRSVDASSLIRRNGALHCVTIGLPNVPEGRI